MNNTNTLRQKGNTRLSLVRSAPRPALTPRRGIPSTPPAVPALYAILAGRIPARDCDRMVGGPGTGGPCAICGKELASFDVQFALEFSGGEDAGTYHVHVPCCMAWQMELP